MFKNYNSYNKKKNKKRGILLFSFMLIYCSYIYPQNFVVFKSPKYAYTFSYPSNFILKKSKSAGNDFNAVKENDFATINMNTLPFDFTGYSFEQVTKKTIEDVIKPQVKYFSINKFTKSKISGYNSIIIYSDVTANDLTFSQITAFIYWNKTPLTFTCSSYKNNFNNYSTLFIKIINSLSLK